MDVQTTTRYSPGALPAPRNAWYVCAFADEITEKPFSRRILGDKIAFYRTEAGKPVALADYCPHRAMALSLGRVVNGDRLQCGYHGLEFDPTGACAHIPTQTQVPRQMKVRSYPLAQRWQWIWIWTGDPELADEALIPDHSQFGLGDNDGFHKVKRFVMTIDGSFELLHENLLDVTHITFLHEGVFDSGAMTKSVAETTVDGNAIQISRRISEVMSGKFARQFAIPDNTKVDRVLIGRTLLPNMNINTNIFSFPDDPGRPPAIRHAPMGITPATATSAHQFVASAGNYGEALQGEELQKANSFVWDVFLTDKEAIESVQQSYLELGSMAPDTSVRADDAALRFRRMLASQVSEQRVPVTA